MSEKAPNDIITDNKKTAVLKDQPMGLPASKLNAKQKAILDEIVGEFANNVPPDLAAERMDLYKKMSGQIHFAWAGGINKGDLHYYRVQTTSLLIEFVNSIDDGNHIHSVIRDFDGDFAHDALLDHDAQAAERGSHLSTRTTSSEVTGLQSNDWAG